MLHSPQLLNSYNSLGLSVMLHPHVEYPIPEEEAMVAMPGHSTSIAYTVEDIKKAAPAIW